MTYYYSTCVDFYLLSPLLACTSAVTPSSTSRDSVAGSGRNHWYPFLSDLTLPLLRDQRPHALGFAPFDTSTACRHSSYCCAFTPWDVLALSHVWPVVGACAPARLATTSRVFLAEARHTLALPFLSSSAFSTRRLALHPRSIATLLPLLGM